ncbi:MAG: hypothetical protein ACHQU1_00915 [Gemmatimonadales bacterium]
MYRRIRSITSAFGLLVVTTLAACSKDSTGVTSVDPGTGTDVNLKGTFATATQSGDIDLTISGAAAAIARNQPIMLSLQGMTGIATVTGCLYLKTTTCVAITGTYNTVSHALSLSTTSPALTFNGTYSGGKITGSITGSATGLFVIEEGTVTVFCGSFIGAANGRWNFVLLGGGLNGVYNDGSGNVALSGSLIGADSLAITFAGGSAGGKINAAGTGASGGWTAGAATGTWSGATTGCRS